MNTTTTASAKVSPSSTLPVTWTLDPAHTTVSFSVRHLMITNVRGEFQKVSGSATFDRNHPELTKLEANIDVASINTREPQRDAHLRSADFFDAEKFPHLTYVSKSARSSGNGKLAIVGDLTIHGVTREVTLEVTDITEEQKDPWGKTRIGASASTKIKRSDFGMTWNAVLEAGGVTVGDEIKISLDASLIKNA